MTRPWYVVVEREEHDGTEWHGGNVVIGPFETEQEAGEYAQNSLDVEDWTYGEAKAQGYVAGEVFWTDSPTIPAHGVNAPIYDEENL